MPKFEFELKLVDRIDYIMYFQSTVFWMILNITVAYLFVFGYQLVAILYKSKLLDWDPYLNVICFLVINFLIWVALISFAALIIWPISSNLLYHDEDDTLVIKKRSFTWWFVLTICLFVTGRFWVMTQTPFAANTKEYLILLVASLMFSLVNYRKLKIFAN